MKHPSWELQITLPSDGTLEEALDILDDDAGSKDAEVLDWAALGFVLVKGAELEVIKACQALSKEGFEANYMRLEIADRGGANDAARTRSKQGDIRGDSTSAGKSEGLEVPGKR